MGEEVFEHFKNNSKFYPNYRYFEYVSERDAIENAFSKIKELALETKEYDKTIRWFETLKELVNSVDLGVIVYGKTVYGGTNVHSSDLDIYLVFLQSPQELPSHIRDITWNLTRYDVAPSFLHSKEFYQNGNRVDRISGWARFGLFNHLLVYPSEKLPSLINIIEDSREFVENSEFFKAGVGELLTYAAYKILDKKEKEYFYSEDEANLFFSKKLPAIVVQTDWGMPTPLEVNREVRQVFKEKFNETDLYRLALAAMRRINIKKEKRKGLAYQFVKELKPRNLLKLPG